MCHSDYQENLAKQHQIKTFDKGLVMGHCHVVLPRYYVVTKYLVAQYFVAEYSIEVRKLRQKCFEEAKAEKSLASISADPDSTHPLITQNGKQRQAGVRLETVNKFMVRKVESQNCQGRTQHQGQKG